MVLIAWGSQIRMVVVARPEMSEEFHCCFAAAQRSPVLLPWHSFVLVKTVVHRWQLPLTCLLNFQQLRILMLLQPLLLLQLPHLSFY